MTTRLIFIVSIFFIMLISNTFAQSMEEPVARIEAIVELPKENPYVGEPLRLVLRSAIHAQVASERIFQPELTDFDWQQFGIDTFSNEFIDGFWMPVVSRVLMIYPLRTGRLTVNSFRRHITYYKADGSRAETELISKPISIDVASRPPNFNEGSFWLPAQSLHISDKWDPDPDKINYGETAKRILTIEAEGLTADRLPNLPIFRAPGIITFARPVERQTIITDHGPVGKVIYQWNVRPVSIAPTSAPAIKLKWFDISKRVIREIVIPERRVAYIQNNSLKKEQENKLNFTFYSWQSAIEFTLSFIATCSLVFLIYTSNSFKNHRWRISIKKFILLIKLLIKAARNQKKEFYSILTKFISLDKSFSERTSRDKSINQELRHIEDSLFGLNQNYQNPRLMLLTFKLIKTIF